MGSKSLLVLLSLLAFLFNHRTITVSGSQNPASGSMNWQPRRSSTEKINSGFDDTSQENHRSPKSPSVQREREQLYEAYNLLHTLAQVKIYIQKNC